MNTIEMSLQDFFANLLTRATVFIDRMDKDDYNDIGFLIEGFLREAECRLEETAKHLQEKFGDISLKIKSGELRVNAGKVVGIGNSQEAESEIPPGLFDIVR